MKFLKAFSILLLCGFSFAIKATASTEITVGEIFQSGENHIGEQVQMKGLLIGVCHHGGKKGFIKSVDGNSPTLRVEVVAGRPFDQTDAGSIVSVTGTLQELRIDEKYINEWEAEATQANHEHESSKTYCEGSCATGKAETPDLKRIQAMRKQLEESGEPYLSIVWVDATNWEVTSEE